MASLPRQARSGRVNRTWARPIMQFRRSRPPDQSLILDHQTRRLRDGPAACACTAMTTAGAAYIVHVATTNRLFGLVCRTPWASPGTPHDRHRPSPDGQRRGTGDAGERTTSWPHQPSAKAARDAPAAVAAHSSDRQCAEQQRHRPVDQQADEGAGISDVDLLPRIGAQGGPGRRSYGPACGART